MGVPRNLLANEGVEKVLGVYWDCVPDDFKFHLIFNNVNPLVISGEKKPTKLEFLNIVISTFDPLGFLTSFIIGVKIILREVWRYNYRWDEQIPEVIAKVWERWRKQMFVLAEFSVAKCIFHLECQQIFSYTYSLSQQIPICRSCLLVI